MVARNGFSSRSWPCIPHAELFSLVDFVPAEQRTFLGGRQVRTSFLQRLPWARTRYRNYLPLMPLAVEQFDLSGFDLVISSSYAVAKGVITGPDQLHVSYVHSPVRFAWDLQHQYLTQSGMTRGREACWCAACCTSCACGTAGPPTASIISSPIPASSPGASGRSTVARPR